MFDDADLHRYGFKLRLANGVFAAAADASEFMLGKFVDDFDARKIGRQRLALATMFGGGGNLFSVYMRQFNLMFRFVEKRHLGSRRVDQAFEPKAEAIALPV